MDPHDLAEHVAQLRSIGADTQDIEVKSAAGGFPKSMLESISSFANRTGGTVLLGLDEDKGFAPSPGFRAREIADALAGACANDMEPPVRATIDIVPFEDHHVVAAEIPPMHPVDKPCYVKSKGRYGGSYIRTGDGDRRLTQYEIDRLIEQREQPTWDMEAVPDATLADLDQDLLARVMKRERALHSRQASASDEKIRQRLHITARTDQGEVPTLAGLLALGDYPQEFFPQLMVSYAVYSGATKASQPGKPRFIDNGRLVGPIPDLVDGGVQVVARNTRTGAVVDGSYRHDLPDYSPIAIREALTNALMHRDYSPLARGTQVQLNIYADHLEITNPGGLYGTVTVDTLGTDGVSSSRNQVLSALLELTPSGDSGYVAENRGSGYAEILIQQEREMLPPPKPLDSLTSFLLRFNRRLPTEAEHGAVNATTSSEERILDYLGTHPLATSKELSAAAGIGIGGTRRILNDLRIRGIIERTEPARSPKQQYRLTGPGRGN
ncbi:ATP-binding protein [Corynebacterium sp.]|uniref:ATP-binding protein n=1 Tax=Corynebacterium sp. TaxID=1720 RepID=UPI0026DAD27A|nr:ATP-binding protein [Corynebacterium sp.]MDO4611107.1 ATP-binding protein [Corynebacterium sp.]